MLLRWKDELTGAIVYCFQKYGFKRSKTNSTCKDNKIEKEFATLLNELGDDYSITVKDFITSENNVTTYPCQINTDLFDWREKAWEEAIEDVLPNDLDGYEG